ncbi:MAG TPA: hypothetical protein PLD37_03655 [Usitatibacteraceae bacterium]|nr:hypothetical protein [Usitatibacteraceae bacterium]
MKTAVGLSLGEGTQDFAFETRFLGKRLAVRRVGAGGSVRRLKELVAKWEPKADAIGLGIAPESWTGGKRRLSGEDCAALLSTVTRVPATSGARLAGILQEWALRHVQGRLPGYFTNARVLFFSAASNPKLAQTFAEFTPNLQFADPVLDAGVPKLLGSMEALSLYASGAHYVTERLPEALLDNPAGREWTRWILRRAMRDATVIVAPVHALDGFGIEELAGKTILTATVNAQRIAHFKAKGVRLVIDAAPEREGRVLDPSLLDAMAIAALGKEPDDLQEDDYLEMLAGSGLEPRMIWPNGQKRVNRFAFVIHPLSQEYFKNVKPIEMLSHVSPPVLMDAIEKAMAYAPPFVYSKVEGIRSPTGAEAEGWLISVGGTPREIMRHSPEFTYRRLLEAARVARSLGAQIMGLGAFTKVVGDAGLTVARRAPLPITTGNSYSASGALWAAHDAMRRLGLVPMPKGEGRIPMKAMVVGATGAIGSVCARLLAMVAEEVHLVSPETAKLLSLKGSILKETPGAKIVVAATTDRGIGAMDMIVTATSGAGKKVLDITRVKPGCVITDVARPLDLPASEVAKRPDVLVIESGEILLPGKPRMKNIGLPPGVAYACLAETIVLALEGRFENFTVGRHIEWEKVKEIYRLGLRHGMRLAAISGVNGPFTDADIKRVKKLALEARGAAASSLPAGGRSAPPPPGARRRSPAAPPPGPRRARRARSGP